MYRTSVTAPCNTYNTELQQWCWHFVPYSDFVQLLSSC